MRMKLSMVQIVVIVQDGEIGTFQQMIIQITVARNCLECKEGGMYGDNTGYYMTNGYFCPVDLDIDGCSAKKDMTTKLYLM